VQNIRGETLTGKTVEWFSENAAILRVDANGQATALAGGVAAVHAKVNGVKSNSVDLTVGADRAGPFVPAGGYAASGTAMLRTENGQVILDLGPNFRTSFALGTYIYLANSTNAGHGPLSGSRSGANPREWRPDLQHLRPSSQRRTCSTTATWSSSANPPPSPSATPT
jgi:hypothetical protein